MSHAVNESLQWFAGAGNDACRIDGGAHWRSGSFSNFRRDRVGSWPLVRSRKNIPHPQSAVKGHCASGMPAIPFSLMDVVANSLDRFVIQRWLTWQLWRLCAFTKLPRHA